MRDLFEFDDEKRFISDDEVVYQVTNNLNTAKKVGKLLRDNENVTIEEIIEELSPARRNLALSVIELYKRIQGRRQNLTQIRNSDEIYKYMYNEMADLEVEECWVILLNQAAKIIRKVRISRGGLASTQVDVRVILKEALKVNATSLILTHNHPSGNIHPSGDDDRLTDSLFKAAKTMNIRMLDHVIVTDGAYYSYADEGRI